MIPRAAAVLLGLCGSLLGAEKFNSRVAILQEFPREVGRGKTLLLSGVVKGAYKVPELIVIAPGGKTYKWEEGDVGEYRFRYVVKFEEGVGPYRLEVMARKANAIESAARFTIWHGVARTPDAAQKPLPPETPAPLEIHPRLLEKRFFSKLNEFRRSIGERPVAWNEKVAERGRQHAARMAKAGRKIHRFGNVGVMQLLRTAREDNLSGPGEGWSNVTDSRPMFPPQPRLPGRDTWNRVVPFVFGEYSLDFLFEKYFVREAAFRLLAADPYCLEVAVGAARPRANVKGTDGRFVYWSVCFVQVNDKTYIDGQDRTYATLLKKAAKRDPNLLRWLGVWGRFGKSAQRLVNGALKDRKPEVSAAAFDALLLLDEGRARRELDRVDERARKALAARRYGDHAAAWMPLGQVRYDRRVSRAAAEARKIANARSREELARFEALDEPERSKALKGLLRRCKGLDAASDVSAALETE